jgi:2-amino-4-hydroxy-6-hydroxymethyldihydropteridine diphosphokinase
MPASTDSHRTLIFVGLGSNVGDRLGWLKFGLAGLEKLGQIQRVSDIYETEPWGRSDQPSFLNAVCSLTPREEDPEACLRVLKALEAAAGRESNEVQWGPRTLDLDLLFWESLIHSSDSLTIPHPRLHLRRFVLIPLLQIAPDLIPPGTGLTVQQVLDACPDRGSVQFWGKFQCL